MWPKLDLQNFVLGGFCLVHSHLSPKFPGGGSSVVRLPNLPSLGCPYKAYKVTTSSLTALSTPATAASATVLPRNFVTQKARCLHCTRTYTRLLCEWRYCHRMGALCTLSRQWVHWRCFMGEDTAVAVTDLCLSSAPVSSARTIVLF